MANPTTTRWGYRMPNKKATTQRIGPVRRFSIWYVCWCDYQRPRAWRLWSRLPGTYRLYRWCEVHQHGRR